MFAPFRCLAAVLALLGAASLAHAEDFGPKSVAISVLGVPLHVPVRGSYTSQPDGGHVQVHVAAVGDLQAVQVHALELARAVRMPAAGCGHKALNQTLSRVGAARIVPQGAVARVEISGTVAVAFCKKILGLEIKSTLEQQSVSISVPVELYLRDAHTIGLRLAGRASLNAGGGLAGDIARNFEGNLNDALTKRLAQALDAKTAGANLPALPGLDLSLDRASFAQDGDKLMVQTEAHGTMDPLAFSALQMFFKQ